MSTETEPLTPTREPRIIYLHSLRPSPGFKLYCEEKKFVYFMNKDATEFEVFKKDTHAWLIPKLTPNWMMHKGRMYPCRKMKKE